MSNNNDFEQALAILLVTGFFIGLFTGAIVVGGIVFWLEVLGS